MGQDLREPRWVRDRRSVEYRGSDRSNTKSGIDRFNVIPLLKDRSENVIQVRKAGERCFTHRMRPDFPVKLWLPSNVTLNEILGLVKFVRNITESEFLRRDYFKRLKALEELDYDE